MEYFRIFLEYAKIFHQCNNKNRRADWRPGRENLAERMAEEKSGIFHGIFQFQCIPIPAEYFNIPLEYGGTPRIIEWNIWWNSKYGTLVIRETRKS